MADKETNNRLRDRTWLERARLIKGCSQKEVAEAAGCSEVFYNRIEKGVQMPNVVMGLRITDFLGIDAHNFLTEKAFTQ